jgi:transposase
VDEAARHLVGHGELRDYVEPRRELWRCARGAADRAGDHPVRPRAAPAFAADLRRLQTIPGVGPIVGATVLAVFSDEPRGVRAHHQTGSGALRAMLREAAHHASRPAHPLHPYFASLCAKRGYKMATIAVAHRLARITFAMLRDGADWTSTSRS